MPETTTTLTITEKNNLLDAAFNAGLEFGKKAGYSLGHADAVIERAERPLTTPPTNTVWCFCDLCGEDAIDTHENLARKGWGLYPNSGQEFCPIHESAI